MGQAITSLGNNNLLGIFGVNDALMHMFPTVHKNIADRLILDNVVFPGILLLLFGKFYGINCSVKNKTGSKTSYCILLLILF